MSIAALLFVTLCLKIVSSQEETSPIFLRKSYKTLEIYKFVNLTSPSKRPVNFAVQATRSSGLRKGRPTRPLVRNPRQVR